MMKNDYDISIKYNESEGIITVIQNGVEKKTYAKKDRWGTPELKFIDLAYLATTLTGGSGENDFWILDADEQQINRQRRERDHSFVIHHVGAKQMNFSSGYMQVSYVGNTNMDSFVFQNGNPRKKDPQGGGSISSALATIAYDAYHIGVDGQERGLIPKLPVYLEFVRKEDRQKNETYIRLEFVDQDIPEWEPRWIGEDDALEDRDSEGNVILRFADD
jgi:hypothetical protein